MVHRSTNSGKKTDGAAKKLADELGVNVLAPTESVYVDQDGKLFITDNEVLAELWCYASDEDKSLFKETGKWKLFKPEKE